MDGGGSVLELRGIRKSFGRLEAVRGVDLRIAAGEFFGFLGPNGAGKSTLMKIFSGFLPADAGEVLIQGRKVSHLDHHSRRAIGLVPQELALYETLTPLQNLRVFADLHRLSRTQCNQRGQELLESVGLWERRHDCVKDFSGGMKRRLNIILSLLHHPAILLCDEPTVGVDPQSRNAIFTFLEEQNRKGLTIVYTTHYMEEVERLCRRIAIIDHGRLLATGGLRELLARSSNRLEIEIARAPGADALVDGLREMGEIHEDDSGWRLVPHPETPLSRIYATAEGCGISYERLRARTPSLENLFLELTGHRLRD